MSDTFEDYPGLLSTRFEALTFMPAHPEVGWLLLRKRPDNVRGMVPAAWLAHVWVGATVED